MQAAREGRGPLATCAGCGARVPDVEGPVHAYVPSHPGCWRAFGELQADEAARFGFPPAHRIVVDAYMAQHPGDGGDRRDRQSVFAHLAGLCAVIERGFPPDRATGVLRGVLAGRDDFPVLQRAGGPGELTLLHVIGAADAGDHDRRAREWAAAVWAAWAEQHDLIRAAVDGALAT